MSVSAISKRYARALVDLGTEQQQVQRFGEELGAISALFAKEEMLRLLLESPSFPMAKKAAILGDLIGKLDPSEGIKKFLGLLLEKDRLQYLDQIEMDFRGLADELSGILRAKVHSASELSTEQVGAIASELEKQTGKKIEIKVNVNPDLIGGLQVEIEGKLFDGSLKTQLKRIEDTLKKG